MNFSDLKAQLATRGVKYQLGDYINRATTLLDESARWPWLYASSTGVAPLTIADLREVRTVTDQTVALQLDPSTLEAVQIADPAGTAVTSPAVWYASASTQVSTWPGSAHTIRVDYIKVPPVLALASDSPVSPTRYHPLIVDYARLLAHEDNDELDIAQAQAQKIASRIQGMQIELLHHEREIARTQVPPASPAEVVTK